ncbi:MAG: hypothetical protein JWM52_131 [Candidatus Saccharibacteria bacterium]|nr:hypothetical protein [Candidatus Saccharibacteria bacterium]
MEFLKLVRRRSFLSEAVYMILNIGLAVALLVVIRYTGSIPLAIALVAVSKWRVLAVRPRYWFANVRSNLIDFIVSVSVVLHMYTINASTIEDDRKLLLLGLLTLLYIGWLLFLKPRSKRTYVAAQAGVAVLLGTAALFTVSYSWPVSVVVVGMWLIGFAAARHLLHTYDEENHGLFISLGWGVVMAEIGWVAYHWTIAYSLPFIASLQLPQVAIIVTLLGFLTSKSYDSFYHNGKIRTNDIVLPLLFTLSIIALLIFVFNRVGTTI